MKLPRSIISILTVAAVAIPASRSSHHAACAASDNSYEYILGLMMNQQWQEAQSRLSAMLKASPRSVDANELAALSACYSNSARSGLHNAEIAASSAPKNPRVLASLALTQFASKLAPQAAFTARHALELDKKNARAMIVLGVVDSGESMILQAISTDPGNYDVNTLAADWYLKAMDFDSALSCFNRMVKRYPNSARVYYERAVIQRKMGDIPSSIADLNQALKLNPNYFAALGYRAKMYAKNRQWKEAIADFTKMMEKEGLGASGYGRRAECYTNIGRTNEAIADYDHAIKMYLAQKTVAFKSVDDLKTIWLRKVELCMKSGLTDKAQRDIDEYLRRWPDDISAVEVREKVRFKSGNTVSALSDLNRLISQNPDIAEYYSRRAAIYGKMGKKGEAANDLARAKKLRTTGSLK